MSVTEILIKYLKSKNKKYTYKYCYLLEEESSQINFSTISYSLMFVKPIAPKKSTQT